MTVKRVIDATVIVIRSWRKQRRAGNSLMRYGRLRSLASGPDRPLACSQSSDDDDDSWDRWRLKLALLVSCTTHELFVSNKDAQLDSLTQRKWHVHYDFLNDKDTVHSPSCITSKYRDARIFFKMPEKRRCQGILKIKTCSKNRIQRRLEPCLALFLAHLVTNLSILMPSLLLISSLR